MSISSKYFLRTPRIGFRLWKEEDLHLAIGLWGDFKVTQFFDARGKLSQAQVIERLLQEISTQKLHGIQYWPIFLLQSGRHLGCCGLRPYDESKNVLEIGFHICYRNWGQGYAFEAARAVMRYAFEIIKVSGLFAGHNPKNEGSRYLLGKLGFRYTHDEFYKPTGLNHPSYILTVNDYARLIKKEKIMIPNQRHMFDLPDDVAYLNIAYTAPLLQAAANAGRDAIQAKQNPWTISSTDFFSSVETVRNLFSEIVGCDANCVAIIPAVSYGIALAAKNLSVEKGQSIVVLHDQFPSNVYSWRSLASQKNAVVKTIPRPVDNDWTPALLESIEDNTAVVAVSNCHWTDGNLIDLEKIGERCRAKGSALVVDGIQSLGALPFSVERVLPDFLVAGAHKWLLGPYSFGFCYVDPKWHTGNALEENWMNRADSEDFSRLVDYRDNYQKGARRFDMGESSNFILSPIAAAALKQILDWGVENIALTLQAKTDAIADRAKEIGLVVAPRKVRAPHLIGISKPGGFRKELPNLLAQEKVFVSVRGESIRIAPHLYTAEEEIERLFSALRKAI